MHAMDGSGHGGRSTAHSEQGGASELEVGGHGELQQEAVNSHITKH